MHKQLLIAIAAICVIALGATGILIMQKDDGAVVADEGILPPLPEPANRVVVAPPPPPVNVPRANLPTATIASDLPTATDPRAATGAEAADGDAMRARISSMVESMSDEERRVLSQELMRRAQDAMRDNMRYSMASDRRLGMLGRNPETRLTPEQEAQVQALRDNMRPKVDAALSTIWSQSEELRNQARTLREQGLDTAEINEQSSQLRQKEREIRQQLDAEFQTSLKAVLSPAQAQALESAPSWGGGNAGGGGNTPGGRPQGRDGGRTRG